MSVEITSPQNARVKQVVRLRERRERDRQGLLLLEGAEELALALAAGARPQTLFICPPLTAARHAGLLREARAASAEVVEVSPAVFQKMAYRDNPDGWLAVLPALRRGLADLPTPANPLYIVAEAVEKPGNLGALLRSADGAGAAGLIVCDPTTDINNPNVVRSSRGTLFSVPVVEAASAEAAAWLRARSVRIVAATPRANLVYTQASLAGSLAIAVGAEADGLSEQWLEWADERVRIPMLGQVNSLNVATAAALLLYEAVRQRNAI